MSIITDEMVEVAVAAASKARPLPYEAMRAALAAVAPLIAKAEREACARVADSRANDMWEIAAAARDEGDQDRSERMTYRGNGANSAAAAIRARSTEDTTP